jgi:hypothetical protein
MGDPQYIAGDFWRICEECGFKTRSSETFKRWDGLWVCEADFEPRHPQDFVKGLKDRIAVPEPRPDPVPTIIGPLTTTITAAALASDSTVSVSSSVRFGGGDHLGVILDDGSTKAMTVLSVPTSTSLTFTTTLGNSVSAGSVVINYSAISQPDIG